MKTFAKAPLALAITALLAAPYALAGDNDFETDASLDVSFEKDIYVDIDHDIDNDISVELDMDADVLDPNHFSVATINREQFIDNNDVDDNETENTSKVYGSGGGASGNIGVNVASGGLNAQGNDAAISKGSKGENTTTSTTTTEEYEKKYYGWKKTKETVEETVTTDEDMVFAKAATFSIQSSSNGDYDNEGTQNEALVEDSFGGASGNIGVNVASGFGNGQHNAMSLSLGQNSSAEATAGTVQTLYDNELDNDVACNCTTNMNNAMLKNSFGGATGNIGVNISSGNANLQSNTLSIASAK
ncbi:MAG: hypothetical protein ACQEUG_05530 [Pseudomonadota bacterium]